MPWSKYRDFIQQVEVSDSYLSAGIEIEFTEELCRVMQERDISRADLARRMGTSPAYITKILNGGVNFTVATMAKLSKAVGLQLRVHLAPKGSQTRWLDALVGGNWRHFEAVRALELNGQDGEINDGDITAAA